MIKSLFNFFIFISFQGRQRLICPCWAAVACSTGRFRNIMPKSVGHQTSKIAPNKG